MYKTKTEIKAWLDEMGIENYSINDDLTVDVDGDVDITYQYLVEIPVQFNIVRGWFDCSHNKLITLKGFPKILKGYLDCWNNPLSSLEYLPIIYGNLYCNDDFKDSIEYKRHFMMKSLRK